MSKCLYKFDEGARQLRCQGFESFLHTLIPIGRMPRQSMILARSGLCAIEAQSR